MKQATFAAVVRRGGPRHGGRDDDDTGECSALSACGKRGSRRRSVKALPAPKPKEGRRLRQPSGVAIHSLAHPGDGRAAVAAGSVPLPARDCGTLRSNGREASAGRSPGRGRFRRAAFPPRCPCDPFAPCGDPASRSGHRSTRSSKGRFIRSPRVGSVARRGPVPSRLWLHRYSLARRRRRSAATRSTRSEDGLCVHGFQSGPLPESIGPCPSACHPRHKAGRCHWTPVRSVHAWPMRTSPLRFPGVASPSRSVRFPEGTCMGQAVTNI